MNRRGFLDPATVAPPLRVKPVSVAEAMSPLESGDPLLELIREYRRLWKAIEDVPGDVEDDHPLVDAEREVFCRICENCPRAATREGALEALRLARENEIDTMGHDDTISLIGAALAFFEAEARVA